MTTVGSEDSGDLSYEEKTGNEAEREEEVKCKEKNRIGKKSIKRITNLCTNKSKVKNSTLAKKIPKTREKQRYKENKNLKGNRAETPPKMHGHRK